MSNELAVDRSDDERACVRWWHRTMTARKLEGGSLPGKRSTPFGSLWGELPEEDRARILEQWLYLGKPA